MHQSFFNKLTGIRTEEILDILINLDNGLFDKEVENKNWFLKIDKFREAAIEVLIKRYLRYYEFNHKKNNNLEKAYNLYLKYYI